MRTFYVPTNRQARFVSVAVRHYMGGNAGTLPELGSLFGDALEVHARVFMMHTNERVMVCWPSNHQDHAVSETIKAATGLHWHGDLAVFRMTGNSGLIKTMTSASDGPFAWDAVRL